MCMGLLLIEFYPEKLTQLFHCMFFIIENIVFIYSFHVSVFVFESGTYSLGMSLQMFSERIVVGAFEDVDQSFNLDIGMDFV